jgi:hypothetical protein
LDKEAGFFPHLSHRCVGWNFVWLDHPAWRRPIIALNVAHEQNALAIVKCNDANGRNFKDRSADFGT